MGILTLDYGTSTPFTITCTIATTTFRQGVYVLGNGAVDHIIGGSFTAAAAAVSATGSVVIYLAASADDGTTYGGGADGTNSAYSGRIQNTTQARSVDVVAINGVYTFSGLSVAATLGQMPKRYVPIIQNLSGATLAAGSLHYQAVSITST